jgi:hypothetical protein
VGGVGLLSSVHLVELNVTRRDFDIRMGKRIIVELAAFRAGDDD